MRLVPVCFLALTAAFSAFGQSYTINTFAGGGLPVNIPGTAASVQFAGLTPGEVGLYQVNAQVPQGTVKGPSVPLTISMGGVVSNTVTIAVK